MDGEAGDKILTAWDRDSHFRTLQGQYILENNIPRQFFDPGVIEINEPKGE